MAVFNHRIGCAWIYYGVVILTTSIFHGSNHCFSETQNTSNDTQCDELSNSSYLNIFWTSVAEVPGLVVTIIIIEVLGRKKTMALEFSLTMVGFLLLFICSTPIVTTLFLFITRAFATGVFQAVYVYTPEVYPTNIRASAMGFHTAAARVGALLTPFNAQVLFHSSDIAAVSLYAASCLIMVISSVLLPIETKGKSMKDGSFH
jgi:MFS family permease